MPDEPPCAVRWQARNGARPVAPRAACERTILPFNEDAVATPVTTNDDSDQSRNGDTAGPYVAFHGVLFVCMGNICRSPTAEAVFRARVADAGLSERIAIA